jgi:hypothetical protein
MARRASGARSVPNLSPEGSTIASTSRGETATAVLLGASAVRVSDWTRRPRRVVNRTQSCKDLVASAANVWLRTDNAGRCKRASWRRAAAHDPRGGAGWGRPGQSTRLQAVGGHQPWPIVSSPPSEVVIPSRFAPGDSSDHW